LYWLQSNPAGKLSELRAHLVFFLNLEASKEWMKRGTTTLFAERELGEPLKRTDLPEGFGPQDLRWRWTALRLILPTGLFRLKDAQGEWDVVNGQQLDLHPILQEESDHPRPDGVIPNLQKIPPSP
jgi:hypothetical protein